MRENKFQKLVKKELEKKAAFIINLHGHLMQRSGLPDLEVIHSKWHGFLELKVEDNKASDIQRSVAARIAKRGVPIYVLRCVEIGMGDIYGGYFKYILEDFDGNFIEQFFNLNELLNILIRLKEET